MRSRGVPWTLAFFTSAWFGVTRALAFWRPGTATYLTHTDPKSLPCRPDQGSTRPKRFGLMLKKSLRASASLTATSVWSTPACPTCTPTSFAQHTRIPAPSDLHVSLTMLATKYACHKKPYTLKLNARDVRVARVFFSDANIRRSPPWRVGSTPLFLLCLGCVGGKTGSDPCPSAPGRISPGCAPQAYPHIHDVLTLESRDVHDLLFRVAHVLLLEDWHVHVQPSRVHINSLVLKLENEDVHEFLHVGISH